MTAAGIRSSFSLLNLNGWRKARVVLVNMQVCKLDVDGISTEKPLLVSRPWTTANPVWKYEGRSMVWKHIFSLHSVSLVFFTSETVLKTFEIRVKFKPQKAAGFHEAQSDFRTFSLRFFQTPLPVKWLPSRISTQTHPLVMWRDPMLSTFSWVSGWVFKGDSDP